MPRNRWIRICILTGVIVLVAMLCWNQIGRRGRFESAAWRSERGNYDGDNSRLSMISDLEQNHLKVGMSQGSVEQILGEPDSTPEASSVYYLGVSPYGFDSEFFAIKYDSDGNLITIHWGRE